MAFRVAGSKQTDVIGAEVGCVTDLYIRIKIIDTVGVSCKPLVSIANGLHCNSFLLFCLAAACKGGGCKEQKMHVVDTLTRRAPATWTVAFFSVLVR